MTRPIIKAFEVGAVAQTMAPSSKTAVSRMRTDSSVPRPLWVESQLTPFGGIEGQDSTEWQLQYTQREEKSRLVPGYVSEALEVVAYGWYRGPDDSSILGSVSQRIDVTVYDLLERKGTRLYMRRLLQE